MQSKEDSNKNFNSNWIEFYVLFHNFPLFVGWNILTHKLNSEFCRRNQDKEKLNYFITSSVQIRCWSRKCKMWKINFEAGFLNLFHISIYWRDAALLTRSLDCWVNLWDQHPENRPGLPQKYIVHMTNIIYYSSMRKPYIHLM